MKFLHLADLHFGKTVNGFSMLEDQRYIIGQIYDYIRNNDIDAVLVAGDVYDRSIPGAEAVTLFDDFLTQLRALGTDVFMISGNHDSGERLAYAGRLLAREHIYVSCHIQEAIPKVTVYDACGPVNIYMLPFLKPMTVKAFYGDENIRTFDDGVRACIEHTPLDLSQRNILMTHHFVVSGSMRPEISDSEMQLSVGGIEEVDAGNFRDFDYTALGHIHRPQRIGSDVIRYAGSLLKYSFSEASHEKVMTVVEIKNKGDVHIDLVPLVPLHDMRKIKGSLKALTDEDILSLADRYDYIHATLTDKEALIEPMNRLRAVYPNVMQLAFERRTQEKAGAAGKRQEAPKDPLALFKAFYEEVMGEPMDDERIKIMEEIIDEAEKADA